MAKFMTITEKQIGLRVDRFLRAEFEDLPQSRIQRALRKGEVRVNKKRVKGDYRLSLGDVLRIPPIAPNPDFAQNHDTQNYQAEARQLVQFQKLADELRPLILYEDEQILVFNKPAGLAVQGGSGIKTHLDGALSFFPSADGDIPRLVHRLDKDTSGVLIVAKSRIVAARLTNAFKAQDMQKQYIAICAGVPDRMEGEIIMSLGKAGTINENHHYHEKIYGDSDSHDAIRTEKLRYAKTDFRLIERLGNHLSILSLWPKTGRTHQIRVHLNEIGCPIYGDGKYGGANAHLNADLGREGRVPMHLHSYALTLPKIHDVDFNLNASGLKITAPLPTHFLQTLSFLDLKQTDIDARLKDIEDEEDDNNNDI